MNLNKPGDYFLIPVSVCQYVLRKKLLKEFRLYMALKSISSGKLVWDTNIKKILADKMQVTVRTIENNFSNLIELKWIRKHLKNIYLQKLDYLALETEVDTRSAVQFHSEDLVHFRGFIAGALIGYLVNAQKLKLRREKHLGLRIKWGNNSTNNEAFYPVSNNVIAQILECSIGTAFAYKSEAAKHNYILLKKSVFVLNNVTGMQITQMRKSLPEIATRLFVKNNRVIEQLPDLVAACLRYKMRKKLKHNKGGSGGKLKNSSL